jgi:hypothetical protein
MAYTINKTDGTAIATITDGTIDTSTSLTLFGKSYSGFGEALNEDLIKLLENSSSTSAPTAPLKGELWFDATGNSLKVYNGSAFEPTGGASSSSTEPANPSAGDMWLDSVNDQVFVYTGDSRPHQVNNKWELIGPEFTAGQTQSGWVIETIGSSGGNKVVASMYAATTRVATLSKVTFTPSPAVTGFASIKAGITLNSTLGAVFEGTNTSAAFVDTTPGVANTSSTVIAGTNFLRADINDATTGSLTIDNDTGLILGDEGELTVSVSSSHVTLAQTAEDKNFTITTNTGGTPTNRLAIAGVSGAMAITGDVTITGNLNISGEYNSSVSNVSTYDDAFIKVNTGNAEADAGLIVETGDTDDARLFYDISENYFAAGQGGTYSQVIRLADAVSDGDATKGKVLKTTGAGNVKATTMTLGAVGSAISTGDTSSTNVPTIGQIATFGNKWGGSEKTVSTSQPTGGDGSDGDFWFVRES